MAVTLTDISNRALQLIGTRTTVTTGELSGGTTNEAIQLNLALTPIQNWCHGLANWNFARKTAALTIAKGPPTVTPGAWTNALPAPPWLYEYTLPADFIRALYITNSTAAAPIAGWLGEPQRFVIAQDTVTAVLQQVLLTNSATCYLTYCAFVTDPTLWPWYFERLVVMGVAKTICLSLTGDLRIYKEISEVLEQQISISMQINTMEGLAVQDTTPEWIQALGIEYPYRRDIHSGYPTKRKEKSDGNN
jgi:hypothetical protein